MADTKKAGKGGKSFKKTECPVSRKRFLEKAPKVVVTINGVPFNLSPREFSTGSFGYNLADKLPLGVDGENVKLQVAFNLIVVGSKDAPADDVTETLAAAA